MRKRFTTGDRVAGVIIGLLMIIGIAFLGTSGKQASNVSPARSLTPTPSATPTHAPAAAAATTSAPATSAPAAVPAPPRTPAVAPPKTAPAAPPTVAAPAPPPVSKPSAPPAQPSCYPLSNEGTCYEPGEYCRDADHGTSGVAGDGEAITCEDNDGWRWEPA